MENKTSTFSTAVTLIAVLATAATSFAYAKSLDKESEQKDKALVVAQATEQKKVKSVEELKRLSAKEAKGVKAVAAASGVDEEKLLEEANRELDEFVKKLDEDREKGIGLLSVITAERINAHIVNDGLHGEKAKKAATQLIEGATFKGRLRDGFDGAFLTVDAVTDSLKSRMLMDVYICKPNDGTYCGIASGYEVSVDKMTEAECLAYGFTPDEATGKKKEIRVLEKEKRLYIDVHGVDRNKTSNVFNVWDAYRTRCYHFERSPNDPKEIEALARAITW